MAEHQLKHLFKSQRGRVDHRGIIGGLHGGEGILLIAAVAFIWVALIPPTLAAEGSGAKTSFYLGLGLISFATGLILPSVSALISLYSDASEQGRNLGILRSAGSLARVIGPVTAALLYFHFGSHFWVYLGGALLMLPAIWIVRGLPDPISESTSA